MHCTNCGAKLQDGASFCTSCGAQVGETAPVSQAATESASASETQQPVAAPQQQSPAKARNKFVIPVVIAVIVVVILAVVLAVVFLMPGNNEKQETVSTSAASSSSAAVTPTFESDLFRITLPEDIASKVSFSEKNNTILVSDSSSNALIASIYPGGEAMENEAKHSTYSLGEVYVGGHYEEAYMQPIFVNASNKGVHWGSNEPVELGITKFLGMTPEQFAACIEISTGSSFVPAAPVYESGYQPDSPSAQQNASTAAPTGAFWGIWDPASKDKAEMEAVAESIKKDHGIDAFVVLTTDWSNLNSEPWYVVSLGQYSSQDAANAALPSIQAIYPDAYVKYSGDKK